MELKDIKRIIKGIRVKKMKDKDKGQALAYDTPLLSVGIDSIFALSILVEIEEYFSVEIDDNDLNMDRVKDISSFAEMINSYLEKSRG